VLTPSVKSAQDQYFGRHHEMGSMSLPEADNLGDDEIDSIKSRDSFYLSTVNENGWPYIQHRGGAPGFLKVLNPTTIGFATIVGIANSSPRGISSTTTAWRCS
jgi:uncharacterized protein